MRIRPTKLDEDSPMNEKFLRKDQLIVPIFYYQLTEVWLSALVKHYQNYNLKYPIRYQSWIKTLSQNLEMRVHYLLHYSNYL